MRDLTVLEGSGSGRIENERFLPRGNVGTAISIGPDARLSWTTGSRCLPPSRTPKSLSRSSRVSADSPYSGHPLSNSHPACAPSTRDSKMDAWIWDTHADAKNSRGRKRPLDTWPTRGRGYPAISLRAACIGSPPPTRPAAHAVPGGYPARGLATSTGSAFQEVWCRP